MEKIMPEICYCPSEHLVHNVDTVKYSDGLNTPEPISLLGTAGKLFDLFQYKWLSTTSGKSAVSLEVRKVKSTTPLCFALILAMYLPFIRS